MRRHPSIEVFGLSLLIQVAVASEVFAGNSTSGQFKFIAIQTEEGDCVNKDPPALEVGLTPCGAATYGSKGFGGSISYEPSEAGNTAHLVVYVCGRTTVAAFAPFAGTYQLTLSGGGATETNSYEVHVIRTWMANKSFRLVPYRS